jgi:arylformamidase
MTQHDGAWYDRMYNNRALVPEHETHFARWRDTSAQARKAHRCMLDVAYGHGPNESLDIFPAEQAQAPVVVFIHGGYWRSLDKSEHSFVAPVFKHLGALTVVPNYALAPAVTIPEIVMQMVKAIAWTYRNIHRLGGDPQRIYVAGHSAGGHLAAMIMACQWQAYAKDLPAHLVTRGLSLSGLFELESVMRTPFVQPSLLLTQAHVDQASPAWLPAPRHATFMSVAGADESEEFIRHNHLIQKAWGQKVVPVCEDLPGLNHFSIVEALTQPGHRLQQLAAQLVR